MQATGSEATSEVTGHPLVSASKVHGTAVYDVSGERLGHVEDVMIHKVSGQVAFAVLSFGGFLGLGEKFNPLPWSVLTYDPSKHGYVVPLGREQLERSPSYGRSELTHDGDGGWARTVNEYYQVTPSWA